MNSLRTQVRRLFTHSTTSVTSVSDPDDAPTAAQVTGVTSERLRNLRGWNLALAGLHTVQAVLVLVLAGSFAIPITSSFPTGPPGTPAGSPEELFDLRIGVAVAVFLALAAVDHLLTGTVLRGAYERDLRRGINRFRWIEYSVSATLMIILIAAYCGITDVAALVAVSGANVAMILFGWIQERMNPPERTATTMMPFWFGTLAGAAPWVAIWINVLGADTVPGFVVGIVVSLQLLFFSFGLNQWLQYKRIGRWRDYVYGEKVYLVLSLVAKSALAWQIFAGSLSE